MRPVFLTKRGRKTAPNPDTNPDTHLEIGSRVLSPRDLPFFPSSLPCDMSGLTSPATAVGHSVSPYNAKPPSIFISCPSRVWTSCLCRATPNHSSTDAHRSSQKRST